MAEKLGEALLDLDTNDKGLKAGIGRAERLSQGLGRTFDGLSKRAVRLGRDLALGAAVGAAALGVLVKRAIDTADNMSKAAQRAGVTTEELSRLAWAGELSDVSLESLAASMGRLANVMAQMARGDAKETKAIFDGLGVSITDTNGRLRSVGEVMPDLAARFAAMQDGAEKSALAIQIFGRSGIDMIPLLNEGREGLAELAAESDRLGKTISTTAGRDAEEFNDSLTRIGAVVDGVMLKVGTGLVGDLDLLAGKLSDPEFVSGAQALAQGVVGAINMVIDVLGSAGTKLSEFGNLLEWMATHNWFTGEIDEQGMEVRRRAAEATLRGKLQRGSMDAPGGDFAGIFGPGDSEPPPPPGALPPLGMFGGKETEAVKELTAGLRDELAVLRETDPVQQRLISMREQLATASGAQRQEVEGLIRTIHEESAAWESAQAAGQFFGDQLLDSIEGLRTGSKSLVDVLDDVINALAQAVLQSMLLGQGPLSGMFGTQGAGGGIGGLLGGLFSGMFAKGGLIPNGTFGIVGENGPEPVIGTSRGAQVLPNSSLAEMMGGGGRGDLHIAINGSGLTQSELSQAIADALDRYDRFTLPGRVAAIQADPRARG